jgi:microcystin-dependent protein
MTESVTGFTAERMLAMEDATVISGSVVGDDLHLQTKDGTDINAGNVRGPEGPTGPPSLGIDAWPIGSIFMSVVSTDPNTLLGGGTWVRFGKGRVLIGVDEADTQFDTVEETGGEKTHILAVSEMPVHTHTQNAHTHGDSFTVAAGGIHDHNFNYSRTAAGGGSGAVPDSSGSYDTHGVIDNSASHSHALTGGVSSATAVNQNTGGGQAHNNLQPYITCYIWKRTA